VFLQVNKIIIISWLSPFNIFDKQKSIKKTSNSKELKFRIPGRKPCSDEGLNGIIVHLTLLTGETLGTHCPC